MVEILSTPQFISFTGHAGKDEKSGDDVCTQVSVLFYGLLTALTRSGIAVDYEDEDEGEDAMQYIAVTSPLDALTSIRKDDIFYAYMIGFKMLAEQYPDNVKVNHWLDQKMQVVKMSSDEMEHFSDFLKSRFDDEDEEEDDDES
jgi:uncharacterized protein YsxB (DUF464 family)